MIGIVEIQACTCSRSSKGPPENEKSRAIIAKAAQKCVVTAVSRKYEDKFLHKA